MRVSVPQTQSPSSCPGSIVINCTSPRTHAKELSFLGKVSRGVGHSMRYRTLRPSDRDCFRGQQPFLSAVLKKHDTTLILYPNPNPDDHGPFLQPTKTKPKSPSKPPQKLIQRNRLPHSIIQPLVIRHPHLGSFGPLLLPLPPFPSSRRHIPICRRGRSQGPSRNNSPKEVPFHSGFVTVYDHGVVVGYGELVFLVVVVGI